MDYEKLDRRDLSKILRCNPPDVPHYQKALEERKRRDQFWMLIVSCAAIRLTVMSSFGRAKTFAPQVKQESWQRVLSTNQPFENYRNDFIQFGQSPQAKHSRNTEDLTDVQLVSVADQTVSHLE